jgi:hypothetical protein
VTSRRPADTDSDEDCDQQKKQREEDQRRRHRERERLNVSSLMSKVLGKKKAEESATARSVFSTLVSSSFPASPYFPFFFSASLLFSLTQLYNSKLTQSNNAVEVDTLQTSLLDAEKFEANRLVKPNA